LTEACSLRVSESYAAMAVQAMAFEISLTPKPGLIDWNDNGAHSDMNPELFHKSIAAVSPWFFVMEEVVNSFDLKVSQILPAIRTPGMRAEEAMFQATKGINTHKGQIFSLGVCLSAAAWLNKNLKYLCPDAILDTAGEICSGLTKEFRQADSDDRSHGELNYQKYHSGGIREEAEKGYPSVHKALSVYQSVIDKLHDREASGLQTLVFLMTFVDDGNVLHRRGKQGLQIMRKSACEFLERGGVFRSGYKNDLAEMNRLFVRENLSPGGCADLLALVNYISSISIF